MMIVTFIRLLEKEEEDNQDLKSGCFCPVLGQSHVETVEGSRLVEAIEGSHVV